MTLISLSRVVKKYSAGAQDVTALDDVSFDIEPAKMTVVLGPSGSGKSTALNMLGGMDTPTSGTIVAAGEEISSYDDARLTLYRREQVGFVFQHYNLIPNLTAAENVGIGSQYSRDAMSPDDALASVGLAGRERSFPSEALRWADATGRDRPSDREEASSPALRRTHRSTGLGDRPRGHRTAPQHRGDDADSGGRRHPQRVCRGRR